jgi:ubiquinone/menaquinone biosynthesis C-methylase UbiE
MDHKQLKNQFKKRAATFDRSARWVKDPGLLDIHRKLAGIREGETVLEACCGTGVVGSSLRKAGIMVVGLDLSLDMLGFARKRLDHCVNARTERLPFADNTFDAVVCRQAMHFLDMKRFFPELLRVIKPRTGRVVISQIVPFGEEDKAWVRRIHSKKQNMLKNFVCADDILGCLKKAGFKKIENREYKIEEPINPWLTDTFFPPEKIKELQDMFINAPLTYKKLHRTRRVNGVIYDTMRWIIAKGRK